MPIHAYRALRFAAVPDGSPSRVEIQEPLLSSRASYAPLVSINFLLDRQGVRGV